MTPPYVADGSAGCYRGISGRARAFVTVGCRGVTAYSRTFKRFGMAFCGHSRPATHAGDKAAFKEDGFMVCRFRLPTGRKTGRRPRSRGPERRAVDHCWVDIFTWTSTRARACDKRASTARKAVYPFSRYWTFGDNSSR